MVSVSATLAAVLSGLDSDLESVATIITSSLPKASNYFCSYILLQGLSVSASTLPQPASLVKYGLTRVRKLTPRQTTDNLLPAEMQWRAFFPVHTNLAVIGSVYPIVSSLILNFNMIAGRKSSEGLP